MGAKLRSVALLGVVAVAALLVSTGEVTTYGAGILRRRSRPHVLLLRLNPIRI
jgi:hypothetical protein